MPWHLYHSVLHFHLEEIDCILQSSILKSQWSASQWPLTHQCSYKFIQECIKYDWMLCYHFFSMCKIHKNANKTLPPQLFHCFINRAESLQLLVFSLCLQMIRCRGYLPECMAHIFTKLVFADMLYICKSCKEDNRFKVVISHDVWDRKSGDGTLDW